MKCASAIRSPSPSGSAMARTSRATASPLFRVLRPPGCPEPSGERVDVASPGRRAASRCSIGLPAERRAVVPALRRAPPRAGQAREQTRAERLILPAEQHEGVLEERDEPRVVAGPGPLVAATGAEGGAGELTSIPNATCDVRGLVEAGASRVEVACRHLHVAQCQQCLGLGVVDGHAPESHHREGHAVQPRSLLVGERRGRLIAGPPCVLDRLSVLPARRPQQCRPGGPSPGRSGRQAPRGARPRPGRTSPRARPRCACGAAPADPAEARRTGSREPGHARTDSDHGHRPPAAGGQPRSPRRSCRAPGLPESPIRASASRLNSGPSADRGAARRSWASGDSRSAGR